MRAITSSSSCRSRSMIALVSKSADPDVVEPFRSPSRAFFSDSIRCSMATSSEMRCWRISSIAVEPIWFEVASTSRRTRCSSASSRASRSMSACSFTVIERPPGSVRVWL